MALIKSRAWDKHVAFWAERVGTVYLLQNHNRILYMAVYEVYLEVDSTPPPPTQTLTGNANYPVILGKETGYVCWDARRGGSCAY